LRGDDAEPSRDESLIQPFEREYAGNPYSWACGEMIVNSAVDLPYYVARIKNGEYIRVENTPLEKLLWNPNKQTSFESLLEKIYRTLLIHGEAGILLKSTSGIKIGNDRPFALYAVTPRTFTITEGNIEGIIQQINYSYKTLHEVLSPDEFLYMRYAQSPINGYTGIGPMHAAIWPIVASRTTSKWIAKLAKNSGLPPVILSFSGQDYSAIGGEEGIQSLSAHWNKFSQNLENRGKPFYTVGDVQPIAINPGQSHVVEMAMQAREDICSAFGVPPILIGDLRNSSYSNAVEATKNFHIKTLLPLANKVCSSINLFFSRWYGDDIKLAIDYSRIEVLQDDQTAYTDMLAKQVELGIIDDEEVREKLGYDVYKKSVDRRIVKAGMIPRDMLHEGHNA
jgi:HK97 family phage portal protein